jgi:hypothetical protein
MYGSYLSCLFVLDRQTLRAERQREDPDHYPTEVQALARDGNEAEKPEEN